jgi:hypothetical protein
MRTLILSTALALVVAAGCKKAAPKAAAPLPPAPSAPSTTASGQTPPAVHAPTGVVINPGISGGSGGAVQAVRKAAARAVTQNEMSNIRIFIEEASQASGQMPTQQQVMQALQQTARATAKLVQDGDIILTGTRQREGIWAYTKEPVSVTGEHLIVNGSGVQRMMPQQIRQALQQQGQ